MYSDVKNNHITVASQSEAQTVFDHTNTGITGSNPTGSIDICLHVCVSYFVPCDDPILRQESPAKSPRIHNFTINSKSGLVRGLNP
jgi:hypothetical protein